MDAHPHQQPLYFKTVTRVTSPDPVQAACISSETKATASASSSRPSKPHRPNSCAARIDASVSNPLVIRPNRVPSVVKMVWYCWVRGLCRNRSAVSSSVSSVLRACGVDGAALINVSYAERMQNKSTYHEQYSNVRPLKNMV